MRIFSFNFGESTHHTTLAGNAAAGLAAPKKNDHNRRAYHREIPVARDGGWVFLKHERVRRPVAGNFGSDLSLAREPILPAGPTSGLGSDVLSLQVIDAGGVIRNAVQSSFCNPGMSGKS